MAPSFPQIRRLLRDQIERRCGQNTPIPAVALEIDSNLAPEAFQISRAGEKTTITGGDTRGALFGVGKWLRNGRFEAGKFKPGEWEGKEAPDCPLRAMYFATHFHNFYHDAPIEEVERYVEELGLWGINTICVWFDMHHFEGLHEPAAQEMLARLKAVLGAARRIGLSTALLCLGNESYGSSPPELRAEWKADQNGYFYEPVGHYHVEICPNKPGGRELILKWRREVLESFADAAPEIFVIWAYDQGGCTCAQCAPWGANGFLSVAEPIARMGREMFPGVKVVVSTWYFDHFTSGEWEGLAQKWVQKPDWADFILADDHGDTFPIFPLEKGVPGGLPLVSFPEISMWGTDPWGGFGANPMPQRLEKLRAQTRDTLAGSFPYSEGIYEDINKVICAGLGWNRAKSAQEIVREYIAFEFSPDVVEQVARAIEILEANLQRWKKNDETGHRFPFARIGEADEALRLLEEADGQLLPQAQKLWRWRILLLRAQIDVELAQNDFRVSTRAEAAMEELTAIYHAQNAAYVVAPPTAEALAANRPW